MGNQMGIFDHALPPSTASRPCRRLNSRGFTLVELIVICAILGVLVLIALPSYTMMMDKARDARCMSEIRDVEKLITAYSIDNGGTYPPNLAAVGQGSLKDPWGHGYEYRFPSQRTDILPKVNQDFDLWSKGADGLDAVDITDAVSQDDIIRAEDGAYVGLVKNE